MTTFRHDVTGAVCSYPSGSVLHTILSRTEGWSPIEDTEPVSESDAEELPGPDVEEDGGSGGGATGGGGGGSRKKSGRG